MRSNISTRASWPARTSLAACRMLGSKWPSGPREGIRKSTNRKENTDSGKDQVCGRECLSDALIVTDITDSCLGAYQAYGFSYGIRKGREDIDRRVEPSGQAPIASLRLIELLNLLLKDSSNAARRIAFLKLCSEWMGEKVPLCASLILFQGIVENRLEVERRCGKRMGLRHYGRGEDSEFVGDERSSTISTSSAPPCEHEVHPRVRR